MIFLLHIKISDQIHLQKYGQKGQNMFVICIYDAVNDYQIQMLRILLSK